MFKAFNKFNRTCSILNCQKIERYLSEKIFKMSKIILKKELH